MSAGRKPLIAAVFVPIMIGLIGFFNLTARPRFAAYHTVDVLQLLATGACFGVALVVLLSAFRSARS